MQFFTLYQFLCEFDLLSQLRRTVGSVVREKIRTTVNSIARTKRQSLDLCLHSINSRSLKVAVEFEHHIDMILNRFEFLDRATCQQRVSLLLLLRLLDV